MSGHRVACFHAVGARGQKEDIFSIEMIASHTADRCGLSFEFRPLTELPGQQRHIGKFVLVEAHNIGILNDEGAIRFIYHQSTCPVICNGKGPIVVVAAVAISCPDDVRAPGQEYSTAA